MLLDVLVRALERARVDVRDAPPLEPPGETLGLPPAEVGHHGQYVVACHRFDLDWQHGQRAPQAEQVIVADARATTRHE